MSYDPLRSTNVTPISTSQKRPSKTYKPNGKREVARRLRQIQNGQLKVTPDTAFRRPMAVAA